MILQNYQNMNSLYKMKPSHVGLIKQINGNDVLLLRNSLIQLYRNGMYTCKRLTQIIYYVTYVLRNSHNCTRRSSASNQRCKCVVTNRISIFTDLLTIIICTNVRRYFLKPLPYTNPLLNFTFRLSKRNARKGRPLRSKRVSGDTKTDKS